MIWSLAAESLMIRKTGLVPDDKRIIFENKAFVKYMMLLLPTLLTVAQNCKFALSRVEIALLLHSFTRCKQHAICPDCNKLVCRSPQDSVEIWN